jgi:hypothetical protein
MPDAPREFLKTTPGTRTEFSSNGDVTFTDPDGTTRVGHLYDASKLWGDPAEYVHASPDGTFPDWHMGPCGWLHHIAIEVVSAHPAVDVKAELTDPFSQPVALYGEASQPEYPWCIRRFALLLAEPVPNVNAAHGYALKLKSARPCTVRAVQWFHPMAR